MSFFGTLSEKPWLTPSAIAHGPVSDVAPYVAARTALNFIMGIVSVLFFLFFITFLSRSQYPGRGMVHWCLVAVAHLWWAAHVCEECELFYYIPK